MMLWFKKIFILFLFIGLLHNLIAQNSFHKLYNLNNRNDFGRNIKVANDQYLIFGSTSGGGNKMSFLSVDTAGILINHKEYGSSNHNLLGGGKWHKGYYGFGYYYDTTEKASTSQLTFVTDSLDSVKTINVNFAFNDRINDAILLEDTTFIVLGTATDTTANNLIPFVAQVDSSGSILWYKEHDSSRLDEFVSNIVRTYDGGFVFSGAKEEKPNNHWDIFLFKVDSIGNKVWEKTYHENLTQRFGHVTACKDGGFAIVGTGLGTRAMRSIIKTDSAGNLLWRKKFGTNTYDEGFFVARQLDDGGFVCAGSSFRTVNGSDIPDICLMRLDSAGNRIWKKDYTYYGAESHDYGEDLRITSDGGFVLTGFVIPFQPGVFTRNDVFILKVDGNGVITSTESVFREVPLSWKVYPNPTQGKVTIPQSEALVSIALLDIHGRLVQNVIPSLSGETILEIIGEAGLYIMQFQLQDGSVQSTKVVKY